MKPIVANWDQECKSRIAHRLDKTQGPIVGEQPMMTASNIEYEVAERTHAIACAGIGVFHLLARKLGLIDAINDRLHLLNIHMPYHESDHVLNIAYNALCGGTCLQDLERLRNDENYLNALGAHRIPDPTTAGDFCRRFRQSDVETLLDLINDVRRSVWAEQPQSFFECATLDTDGSVVGTTGECKEGMDISYKGIWGYHPLLVSLANTREVLGIVNRSGNRPSHENAAKEIDRAVAVCLLAGFRKILLRGDNDFSQTEHLDRWHRNPKIRFIFGYDAKPNLVKKAENLPVNAWRRLVRPARYQVKTQPRKRPVKVKDRIVREREYTTLRLESEDVAEFDYQPVACDHSYRMVVVRKNINKVKGEQVTARRSATSSTSPMNGSGRRRKSCSRPTTDATRRTWCGAVEERCAGVACSVEHAQQQLGVHGDDGLGVESEGVVGVDAAGIVGSGSRVASGRKAMGAAVGVQDVFECLHPAAVPDHQDRPQTDLSFAELEPPSIHLLPVGQQTPMLSDGEMKSGSGCPDPR